MVDSSWLDYITGGQSHITMHDDLWPIKNSQNKSAIIPFKNYIFGKILKNAELRGIS
jgi:hypothetical protein